MHKKHAFTLVELLVVIAIIGMLIALLLPAVNSVRGAGRLTTCKNHLRQQALGIRSYAQLFSEDLPSIWTKGASQPYECFSWRVTLLPHIEEQARFDRINQNVLPLHPKNAAVADTIETFSCPSSPGSPRVIREYGGRQGLALGATDYAAVFDVRGPNGVQSGAWFGGESPDSIPFVDPTMVGPSAPPPMAPSEDAELAVVSPDYLSAKLRKSPSTLRRVRDGLSNTVLIVEQAGKPLREIPPEEQDELIPGGDTSGNEGAWLTGEYASFYATAVNQSNYSGPYGYHNGAAVAMCDGSVHFWSRDIAPDVMFALLSREGSEIVSSSDW